MKDAPEVKIDAVWDIEAAEWDQFVTGALWTPGDGIQVYSDEDEFAGALLELPQGCNAWAHAGGRYDVLWLLDWCKRRGHIPKAQIRLSGSSIASLAIKQGPIFRDSCRLMPMSLRQACTMFEDSEHKEELDLPCICGRQCGGYCSISTKMPRKMLDRLNGYLVKDIESLRDTLVSLDRYCAEHRLVMSGTVASTAWNTAKVSCDIPDTDWDNALYRFARSGYYGGRTEVGQTEAARIWRYDRVSAYPAALSEDVPTGEVKHGDSERTARLAWKRDKPGFYKCIVEIPNCIAPPLPIRLDNRLAYPYGRVVGVWSRDEIHRAEEIGSKVLHIFESLTWARESPQLKPHVEHCFGLREKAQTKSLRTWLKFIANSLTGAFAQDPETDVIALGEEYADRQGYEPVGNYDWIWRRKVFRISERAHIQWAGVLTARARVELNRQIEHAGLDWCYSDTDSVISTRELGRNIGDNLGQWKFEGTATDFEAIAPKVYTYKDSAGDRFARAKGIPDAVREWDKINSGENIEINRGVKSLLVAARGDSLFQRNDGRRHVNKRVGWCGARIKEGTRTRAPHVKDLPNLPR